MKRLLITGAGGFLGSHLVHKASSMYEIFGLSYKSPLPLDSKHSVYFDIADSKQLVHHLKTIQPDFIIHAAALSSEGACRKHSDLAHQVNVESVAVISNYCKSNNVKLIFTSTDLVFGGNHAPYDVYDQDAPQMKYGQLKLLGEQAIKNNTNAIIVRLPLLYGIGLGERKGLLHQFIENCKEGNTQGLFSDEYRTPAYVEDVATFIIDLIAKDFFGYLHLGGKERISRFGLGEKFCQYLDLENRHLKRIARADINMSFRPADTCLLSNKAYQLGFSPQTIQQNLFQLKDAML